MPALETVGQYIAQARVLLQDKDDPFRYSDTELVEALNLGLLEARRLRADLFLPAFVIPWTDPSLADPKAVKIPIDPMYRPAFLYYMVGQAQLRDDEATTDSRAAAFIGKFSASLLVSTS